MRYFGGYFSGAGGQIAVTPGVTGFGTPGAGLQLYPPFTIHEADFSVYLADEDVNAPVVGPVFMGGRLETLEPELNFTKVRLDRHGDPYGRNFHSDEEHRFTVKNLWVMERGSNWMPQITRNQQYVFVVRWYDKENETWTSRSYYGVTADGQSLFLQDQVFHENIPFTARFCDERYGLLDPPSLQPTMTGSLRYVTAVERPDLYLYDSATGQFTSAGSEATLGRAELVIAADSWEMRFAGTPAMRITDDGVFVKGFSSIGGTFPLQNRYPRMEFWIGPTRLAAVTANGEFCAPRLLTADEERSLPGRYMRVAVADAWAFSVGGGAAWSRAFEDSLA